MNGEAVNEVLDEVIADFGSKADSEVMAMARKFFDGAAGVIHEDEALYEARIAAFLEWFVCEYVVAGDGAAPVVCALQRERDPERRARLFSLASSLRSLFEIEQTKGGALGVMDLLGGARFEVSQSEIVPGLEIGNVVEARLIALSDRVVFGRTFLYHPAGCKNALLAWSRKIQEAGGGRSDVVAHAAHLRIRSDRFQHISPARIYDPTTSEFVTPSAGRRSAEAGRPTRPIVTPLDV